jgi:hypothetical protein
MEKIRDQLNNPLVFILLVTLGVFSFGAVAEWWAKARHHNGASQLFKGRIL